MLELNSEQRSLAAEKLADTANIAAGALIFGQAIGDGKYSLILGAVGLVTWVGFFGYAVLLRKRRP